MGNCCAQRDKEPRDKPEEMERVIKVSQINLTESHQGSKIEQANIKQLEIRRTQLENSAQKDIPQLIKISKDLGSAYLSIKDYRNASVNLQFSLEMNEIHFGYGALSNTDILDELAQVQIELGQYPHAIRSLQKSLGIKGMNSGVETVDAAHTLIKIGNVYGLLGYNQKRLQFCQAALPILLKTYAENHNEIKLLKDTIKQLSNGLEGNNNEQDPLNVENSIESIVNDVNAPSSGLRSFSEDFGSQQQIQKLEKLLQLNIDLYGDSNQEVLKILVQLSIFYGQVNDYEKQHNSSLKAIKILEGGEAQDQQLKALAYLSYGNALRGQFKYAESRNALERSLELHKEIFGEDHHELAVVYESLGKTFGGYGNYTKQKEFLEQGVRCYEKHYGPENIQTATCLVNLAGCAGNMGDFQRQLRLLERALIINEKVLGIQHSNSAEILILISNVRYELGQYQPSLEKAQNALTILENSNSINTLAYVQANSQIARILCKFGDYMLALVHAEEAQKFVDRSKVTLERNYWGKIYGRLGDLTNQTKILEDNLNYLEQELGSPKDLAKIALTLVDLAYAYFQQGDYEKQQKLLERALEVIEELYGPEHPESINALVQLAKCQEYQDNITEDLEFAQKSCKISERVYGSEHIRTARTKLCLADAQGEFANYKNQSEILEKVLKIYEKFYGTDHQMVALVLIKLARAYGNLDQKSKQQKSSQRATQINQNIYGNHPITGLSLVEEAQSEEGENKLKLLQQSLSMVQQFYARDHCDTALVLEELGRCELELENFTEAQLYFDLAKQMNINAGAERRNERLEERIRQLVKNTELDKCE